MTAGVGSSAPAAISPVTVSFVVLMIAIVLESRFRAYSVGSVGWAARPLVPFLVRGLAVAPSALGLHSMRLWIAPVSAFTRATRSVPKDATYIAPPGVNTTAVGCASAVALAVSFGSCV